MDTNNMNPRDGFRYNFSSAESELPAKNTSAYSFLGNSSCQDILGDYLVIRGGLGTTLAVFGMVGNILAIIVLSHRKMRSPTSYFLICLAGYDNMILTTLLLEVMTLYTEIYIKMAFMPILVSLEKIGQTGTVSMTLTIALERYIGITRPFSGMTFCDGNMPFYIIFGVILFSLLYNIPYYMSFKFDSYFEPDLGRMWIRPQFTEHWNSAFNKVYQFHVQVICMYILPWVGMLILNLLIIRAIWKRRRSSSLSRWYRSNKLDKRMTLAVLAVTTLFFIAYPFTAILDDVIFPKELLLSDCPRSRTFFVMIRDLLIVLNSATNFLFYCVFGKKFRHVFLLRFCPRRARKLQERISTRFNRFSSTVIGSKTNVTSL